MDAKEYAGFLLLMEEVLSQVAILAVGAKELEPKGVQVGLADAVICINDAINLYKEKVGIPSVSLYKLSDNLTVPESEGFAFAFQKILP